MHAVYGCILHEWILNNYVNYVVYFDFNSSSQYKYRCGQTAWCMQLESWCVKCWKPHMVYLHMNGFSRTQRNLHWPLRRIEWSASTSEWPQHSNGLLNLLSFVHKTQQTVAPAFVSFRALSPKQLGTWNNSFPPDSGHVTRKKGFTDVAANLLRRICPLTDVTGPLSCRLSAAAWKPCCCMSTLRYDLLPPFAVSKSRSDLKLRIIALKYNIEWSMGLMGVCRPLQQLHAQSVNYIKHRAWSSVPCIRYQWRRWRLNFVIIHRRWHVLWRHADVSWCLSTLPRYIVFVIKISSSTGLS